ncbi:MAG: hypothetical protein CL730_03485 [Chloroflexi bacterium]|nr:hypothetical protein [Chloroflexota bacterium]
MKNKPTVILFSIFIFISVFFAGIKILLSNNSNIYDETGIIFIDPNIINSIQISDNKNTSSLYKVNESWRIGKQTVFEPKLSLFWKAIANIQKSELISVNPKNFKRMGFDDADKTLVRFFLESTLQEEFLVGKWDQDTKTCFIKKLNIDQVYGFTCPYENIFATDPDMWRNPIILSFPPQNIDSIKFSYPDREFEINLSESGWVLNNNPEIMLDTTKIAQFANLTQLLLADGFLSEEEAVKVDFNQSDALITFMPKPKTSSTISRIRLKQIDANKVAIKSGNSPIIYFLSLVNAQQLLPSEENFYLSD